MASESIYQQEHFLFQTGHPGPEDAGNPALAALLKHAAQSLYRQMAETPERHIPTGKGQVPENPKQQLFEALLQNEAPESFNIETPEQAKALLVLAHFDKQLNRMVIEQQPLSKADIRSAYRRILKHYHPDQSHQAITGEIIQKVQSAYALLRPRL